MTHPIRLDIEIINTRTIKTAVPRTEATIHFEQHSSADYTTMAVELSEHDAKNLTINEKYTVIAPAQDKTTPHGGRLEFPGILAKLSPGETPGTATATFHRDTNSIRNDLKFAVEWLGHPNIEAAFLGLGAWQTACEALSLTDEVAAIEQFEDNVDEFLANAKEKAATQLAKLDQDSKVE